MLTLLAVKQVDIMFLLKGAHIPESVWLESVNSHEKTSDKSNGGMFYKMASVLQKNVLVTDTLLCGRSQHNMVGHYPPIKIKFFKNQDSLWNLKKKYYKVMKNKEVKET